MLWFITFITRIVVIIDDIMKIFPLRAIYYTLSYALFCSSKATLNEYRFSICTMDFIIHWKRSVLIVFNQLFTDNVAD